VKFNLSLFIIGSVFAFLIILNICAFSSSIRRPFSLDEAEEATMGIKINKIGYRTFLPPPQGGGMQISHALLYTYTHALVSRLFGQREFPLRMYGVFHYLISLCLVLLIVRRLTPEKYLRRWAMAVALALYISNPLLLQHSTVINADNNILTTMILLFLYFFLFFEEKNLLGKDYFFSRVKLSILLALCFWAKEITPVFVIVGILAYRILNRQRKELLGDFFMGMLGVSLFWGSWWLYCLLTNTEVLAFVKFTIANKSKLAFSPGYIKGVLKGFLMPWRWPIYWVSAPFFVVVIMILIHRIRRLLREKRATCIDCFLTVALCIWLPYLFFKPNPDTMKYQYPSYPIFIMVISYYCAKLIQKREKLKYPSRLNGKFTLLFTLLGGILLFHYYNLGDYILVLWQPLSKHLNSHFFIYYYLPILMFLSLILVVSPRSKVWGNSLLGFTFLIFPINGGLLINQAKANYSTTEIYLNYGESGLRETVEYLANHITPNSTIAVRGDLSYHLVYRKNVKIKENVNPILVLNNPILAEKLITVSPIEYLVLDKVTGLAVRDKRALSFLSKYFICVKKLGTFYIFRFKGINYRRK